MTRKKGTILLPLEESILEGAVRLQKRGDREFYGFALASVIAEGEGARKLISRGILYKVLERLEGAGFLSSRWEDAVRAAEEHRPRRRYYQLTPAGSRALAQVNAARRSAATLRGRLADT